jgi:arylsulfatase A-like enzyme
MSNRAVRRARRFALLLVGCALAACARAEAPRRPNVVVVVVDTLRADRVGAERPHGSLTPFLDEVTRRGTQYTRAYSTSSWTSPSVASLFTSRYPSQHLVRGFGSILNAGEVTLAERLHQAGYVTAGFSANPQLPGHQGWNQGFDAWQTFPAFKLRGAELTQACLRWLDGAWTRDAGSPVFLYLQYMEPHAPYEAPPAIRATVAPGVSDDAMRRLNGLLLSFLWADFTPADVVNLTALYDAEVAAVDAELRALFDGLTARGVLDDALVVVTADHGEEFKEHQFFVHGLTLFEPAIHVPLLVVGETFPAGHAAETRVSLVDVAPTVLEHLGLPGQPHFEGRSLLPAVHGLAPERDTLIELLSWQERDWRQHEAALIQNDLKLLVPPAFLRDFREDVIYDLARDPLETHPNPPGTAVPAVVMRAELARLQAQLASRQNPGELRKALSPEQRERLRALGYVE